jgi:hypothetical protein
MRSCISNHILLRWNPEWDNLDVVDRRNEEQTLAGKNCWSLDPTLVESVDNTRIFAGEADDRPLPFVLPQKKGWRRVLSSRFVVICAAKLFVQRKRDDEILRRFLCLHLHLWPRHRIDGIFESWRWMTRIEGIGATI